MKFTLKIVVCLALFAISAFCQEESFCWKHTYNRGTGKPVSTCPSHLQKDGALCYPFCNNNYYGVGPVCWGSCQGGMTDTGTQCQKKSYGRGAGRAVWTCPAGYEQNGGLCYRTCAGGYYGVGPVCWGYCPDGWSDTGALCQVWAHSYGKGCCCTIFGCCGRCGGDYTDMGCTCYRSPKTITKNSYGRGAGIPMGCGADEELNGGLCYPKCSYGYSGVGPVCWQNCVGETTDAGATCTKRSYGRTAGTPMICKPNEQYDAGLCYTPCNPGYKGIAHICWRVCPPHWAECGAACASSQEACAGKVIDMVSSTIAMIANIATMATAPGGMLKVSSKMNIITRQIGERAGDLGKFNQLVEKIQTANRSQTLAEAVEDAKMELGAIMVYQQSDEMLDLTWSTAAELDPTGVLGAAKAFFYPICAEQSYP